MELKLAIYTILDDWTNNRVASVDVRRTLEDARAEIERLEDVMKSWVHDYAPGTQKIELSFSPETWKTFTAVLAALRGIAPK